MRNYFLIVASLVGISAFAESEILSGKIVSVNPTISSTTVLPVGCNNEPGRNSYCPGIELRDVTIQETGGKRGIWLRKLIVPVSAHGGLMGMGPSGESLAMGLAIVPKDNWGGMEQIFESAEMTDFAYVMVPEDKISANAESSEPVGFARMTVVLKVTESFMKESNQRANENKDETARAPKDGLFVFPMGEYLDLSKF